MFVTAVFVTAAAPCLRRAHSVKAGAVCQHTRQVGGPGQCRLSIAPASAMKGAGAAAGGALGCLCEERRAGGRTVRVALGCGRGARPERRRCRLSLQPSICSSTGTHVYVSAHCACCPTIHIATSFRPTRNTRNTAAGRSPPQPASCVRLVAIMGALVRAGLLMGLLAALHPVLSFKDQDFKVCGRCERRGQPPSAPRGAQSGESAEPPPTPPRSPAGSTSVTGPKPNPPRLYDPRRNAPRPASAAGTGTCRRGRAMRWRPTASRSTLRR